MSVIETTSVPLDQLHSFPANPRQGDVGAIVESLRAHGQYRALVVNKRTGQVLAGNHTLAALRETGAAEALIHYVDVDEDEAKRIVLVDNRSNDLAAYDDAALLELLRSLPDLSGTGYSGDDLDEILALLEPEQRTSGDTEPTGPFAEPTTRRGDLWVLGDHRLLCGDSTISTDVARLFVSTTATMIHADPPYGMGKEAEGIANDNLYGPKLDAFQVAWWTTWLPALSEAGSAYIWGNAPDLWRLWWIGGLSEFDDLVVRNEIVWDKGSGFGMSSAGAHSYPPASERCLFLMRGQQFLGNQNIEDYWEGYEPLRLWLEDERDRAGWTNGDVNRITATKMASHWFSRSQFQPISREHYDKLTAASQLSFQEPYEELFSRLFPDMKGGGNAHRRQLSAQLRESRTFFDNTHDTMTDVWQFPRVIGEERFNHATPKPVAMVERAIKTSSEPGDSVAAPFGGTGPEVIACENLGRSCYVMELDRGYCDVIVDRWERHTGRTGILET